MYVYVASHTERHRSTSENDGMPHHPVVGCVADAATARAVAAVVVAFDRRAQAETAGDGRSEASRAPWAGCGQRRTPLARCVVTTGPSQRRRYFSHGRRHAHRRSVYDGSQGRDDACCIAAGGADPSFNQLSINTLYNQSTSTIGRERIYNGASLSLPGKLSWTNAKALMQALLDAVTHVRLSPGRAVELSALIMKMPPPPLDTPAQTLVNAIVGIITTETTERLDRVGDTSGGGGSSSNAAASTASTSSVSPQPVPIPVLAAEPFALNSALSLRDNVMRLLQSSMHRSLDQTETDTLDGHLLQALSVLQAGGEQARRDLLSTGVLQALLSTGGAYLWAAALEASENGLQSVDEYGEAVVSTTSEVSTALFATALGV